MLKLPPWARKINLAYGAGKRHEKKVCIMQFVSAISPQDLPNKGRDGNWWSDVPNCVNHQLSDFMIGVNDGVDSYERNKLLAFAPRFLGTDAFSDEDIHQENIKFLKEVGVKTIETKLGAQSSLHSVRKWASVAKPAGTGLTYVDNICTYLDYVLPQKPLLTPSWDQAKESFLDEAPEPLATR